MVSHSSSFFLYALSLLIVFSISFFSFLPFFFLLVSSDISQGSVLGPLLFTLFISDLFSASTSSKIFMYADIVLLLSFEFADSSLTEILNIDLSLFRNSSNSLYLNPSKSSLVITESFSSLSFSILPLLSPFPLPSLPSSLPLSPSLPSLSILFLSHNLFLSRFSMSHFDFSWSFCHHVSVKCQAVLLRLHLLYPFRYILTVHKLLVSQLLYYFSFWLYQSCTFLFYLKKCYFVLSESRMLLVSRIW